MRRFHQSPANYPVPLLLLMLRLGHKYQCEHLKNVAAKRIKDLPPTTREDWNKSDIYDPESITAIFIAGYRYDFIHIAREVGLRSVLPLAYFVCMCMRLHESLVSSNQMYVSVFLDYKPIIHGVRRADGSISTLKNHFAHWKGFPSINEDLRFFTRFRGCPVILDALPATMQGIPIFQYDGPLESIQIYFANSQSKGRDRRR